MDVIASSDARGALALSQLGNGCGASGRGLAVGWFVGARRASAIVTQHAKARGSGVEKEFRPCSLKAAHLAEYALM